MPQNMLYHSNINTRHSSALVVTFKGRYQQSTIPNMKVLTCCCLGYSEKHASRTAAASIKMFSNSVQISFASFCAVISERQEGVGEGERHRQTDRTFWDFFFPTETEIHQRIGTGNIRGTCGSKHICNQCKHQQTKHLLFSSFQPNRVAL